MRKLLLASAASMGALLAATSGAMAQPAKPVAPGTVAVHLNGYLQFAIGDIGGNGMTGGTGATAYKLSPVGTIGDVRLYPGVDGMTEDGIAYGAQVELRTTTSNAGKGVNNTTTNSSGVNSFYVRRAYGYIGTTEFGYVRYGQTDGAFTLLQRGVIEAFGDGAQWTAEGAPVNLLPSGAPGQFIYADQGALYTTDKLVYISPALAEPMLDGKFSAVISFEPNSNGIKEGYASLSSINGAQVSSIAGGSNTRRRNTFDGMINYGVNLGGFATQVSGGYLASSPLGNLTGAQAYSSMGVFQAGAQTTYGGLTVGANLKSGSVEDGYAFKPRGARNALAYTVGAVYVVGPYSVGASYFNSQTSGGWTYGGTTARTLSEYGFATGANYAVAKPVSLFVEYMYGHKHQPAAATKGN
ncbi:porin, partial [Acidocella sp.]|uniref:porin n=1 Tax=Acidocella sp. TaxID=50710 RepID=UPI0026229811